MNYGNNFGYAPFNQSFYNPGAVNPQYAAPQSVQNANPADPNAGAMQWVQGEAAAKAWMVAPGCRVVLWDSENPVIYIKSADMAGIPSMRIFEYKERTADARQPVFPQETQGGGYVSAQEFSELSDRVAELTERVNAIGAKPAKSAKAKEESDNA